MLASFGATAQVKQSGQLNSILYNPNDDAWRVSAEARIEQLRKANIEINVIDDDGHPIPNATVSVKMKRHAFGFGSLIGQSRWEDSPNPEDARRHRELVEKYFPKIVTLPEIKPSGDIMLTWLNERKIKVKGHYLMWAKIQPGERNGQPPVMPEDIEVLREVAFQYIKDMVTWAGNRISEWNAINHIVTDLPNTLGYDHLFGPEFFADEIKYAREYASPGVEMWVNEGNILSGDGSKADKYVAQIQKLIQYGGKPDGIGFMAHYKGDSDLISMEEIYKRLDRFAELIPNLHLTEFDIDVNDPQLHANYLRDVMTIAFSHPAVSGIIMWQIWGESVNDKTLWNPDWTFKPAGEALLDLVYNQWWTDEAGVTDSKGTFSTRGFLGDYEISVQLADQKKTILSKIDSNRIVLNIRFSHVSIRPIKINTTYSVKTYPNPAMENATFEITSNEPSSVRIIVLDLNGKEILSVKERINQGTSQIYIDLNGISSGIYFYQVQNESFGGMSCISCGKIIKIDV